VQLVYYSTKSGNTKRFVNRLGLPCATVEDLTREPTDSPFVLITPTYNGQVPAPVIRFLNVPANRERMLGVISGGSTNFGADYARAGQKIAQRCGVPVLYSFELSGLDEDVAAVHQRLTELPWNIN
jgi:protein involved in ribonucleotide reduction